MPMSRSTAPTRLSAFALRSWSRRLESEFVCAPKKRDENSSAFVKSGSDPSTLRTSTLLFGISGSLLSDIRTSATTSPPASTSAITTTTMIKAILRPRVISCGLLFDLIPDLAERLGEVGSITRRGVKRFCKDRSRRQEQEAGADGRRQLKPLPISD